MRFLLDDELLSGVHDTLTLLRPQRAARPVDEGDAAGAMQMMTYLCQVWGGHAHPIIPVRGLEVPESYQRCLRGDQYDIVGRLDHDQPGFGLPDRIRQERAWDYPAVIVAAHARRALMAPVDVAELEPGDPWAPIYAATLGVLPRQLDESLQKVVGHPQALPLEATSGQPMPSAGLRTAR